MTENRIDLNECSTLYRVVDVESEGQPKIEAEVRPDKRKKLPDGLAALWGNDISLLTQCRQIVAWIACNDSVEGPLNQAEAHQMSEADTAAVSGEHRQAR